MSKSSKPQFWVAFIALLVVPTSHALTGNATNRSKAPLPPINQSTFEWAIAPQVNRVLYTEPDVMSEEGNLYGGRLYGQWRLSNFSIRSELEVAMGQLAYKGKDWSGQAKDTTTEDLLSYLSLQCAYNLLKSGSFDVSLTVGARLRLWNQVLQGKGGYPRELAQIYAPFGVQIRHGSLQSSDFTYRLEYAPLVYGEVNARLSRATDDIGDQRLRQNQGEQYLAAVDWRAPMSQGTYSLLGLYYKVSDIGKSQENKVRFNNQDFYVYEPQNRSTEVGLSAGLSF